MKKENNALKVIFGVLFLSFYFVLLIGCSSVKEINSYTRDDKSPICYQVLMGSINVDVDFIKKADIEDQMERNLRTMFMDLQQKCNNNSAYKNLPKENIYVDLVVSQQSFMKNMEIYNSIFANSVLRNENGDAISLDCLNKETRSTLVSSIEQNKVCNFVYEKVFNLLDENLQKCIAIEKEQKKDKKKNKKE